MDVRTENLTGWERRKARVRKKISGTAERPRLNVYRSNRHIYAQIIDDTARKTIVSASTKSKEFSGKTPEADKTKAARVVGELIGRLAVGKGIEKVVFDRSGYLYHGRIKALADGARGAGLKF
jgi:large subunit ribosomal protein L18